MRILKITRIILLLPLSLIVPFTYAYPQLERSPYKSSLDANLDLIEIEREMIMERQLMNFEAAPLYLPMPAQAHNAPHAAVAPEKPMLLATLYLDESFPSIPQPIEIEQGNYIRVVGKSIKRFLLTESRTVAIERQGLDELYITGKENGYTYVHVWDNQGRWGIGFLTTPPKPKGLTVAEEMRLAEKEAHDFKLRYIMDWSSFESGRRLDELNRGTYSYYHSLTLDGPTPYGDLDSSVTGRNLNGRADLSYFTLGLTHGVIGDYKDFSLRAFDFSPGISNLAFYDVYERGVLFKSPAFDNTLDYTIFWGRELPGISSFGLSPGLQKKTIDAFISGLNLSFMPQQKQKYSVSVFHGWGDFRDEADLRSYGYDAGAEYHLGPWDFIPEAAYDSKKSAELLRATYRAPTLKLTTEVRDSDKQFLSMSGGGYRAGELGALSTVTYTPSAELRSLAQLDVYRDRRFPNPEHGDYWNQVLSWNTVYTPCPKLAFPVDYALQNNLGKIGAFRYQKGGLGASYAFDFIRKINVSVNGSHQKNQNFSSPGVDYTNERATANIQVNLLGALYYYLNGEYNWLTSLATGTRTHPQVYGMGLDWRERISHSPLYVNFNFAYRNEEDTSSPVSFLSGQDNIEGYTELSWRTVGGSEIYCSSRVRNVWAEKEGAAKHIDLDLRAGIRYLWDTGFHWDSVGTVYGYVFRDLNDDGLMQRDEAPVEGVRVWLGQDQSQVTDVFGYYCFPRAKGRKAHLNIDVASLPAGFVLTGPATQDAGITHGQAARVDFGIISRSEITGTIFEDSNNNGAFDSGESGIKEVVVMLENGEKAATDNLGRYFFRKVSVGKHTITIDLKTLPTTYIPALPIFKDMQLFEGVSYVYNIPLKRIPK